MDGDAAKSLNGAATDSAAPLTNNPLALNETLKRPAPGQGEADVHPQREVLPGDSAVTRAEKIERIPLSEAAPVAGVEVAAEIDSQDAGHPAKRIKTHNEDLVEDQQQANQTATTSGGAEAPTMQRQKGAAPIKKEYLVENPVTRKPDQSAESAVPDDDAAEAGGKNDGGNKKKKERGQNKARTFGSSRDELQLCKSRTYSPEFSPQECQFGDSCRFEHNLRTYLSKGKRADLTTFNSQCPIFQIKGKCSAGWKCRFVGSHSTERDTEDGRKELVLIEKPNPSASAAEEDEEEGLGVVNIVPMSVKIQLRKKKTKLPKSEAYVAWLDKRQSEVDRYYKSVKAEATTDDTTEQQDTKQDVRAAFTDPPFRPSEKRRIYYGAETPVLAPLTTQGNLPFRRLAVDLGAQVTWSEMAMGLPLIQGEKGEWALVKAHESELKPPRYTPKSLVQSYDNSKDIKFGVQLAGNKPWNVLKATEVLTANCPYLRAIDLNCGCPIDLVYRQGAGSALLDSPGKLEKILRGMNAVSNEVPITVKIRMGTRDNHPTADKLVQRLVLGGEESVDIGEGPAGVAAITLHGRSRQQRYTRDADWEYIADCAATINRLQEQQAKVTDTIRQADDRDLTSSNNGNVYFCGNGDCYSHIDYYNAIEHSKVDSVMIGRGALIKPWIFEEIASNQYLDKSASERLGYIEQFVRYGLENWGSDEVGVGVTRRFLLEWLSFSCRYVPIGLLEHLPPRLGDRPPAYRGRNELETLLASPNYKDWIKISEMFLGPAHKDFQFVPKHKSNSYEIEAEG
ncbi:hypothetical protein AAFC00_000103 [Neodothiora populina]|uniref:tRNA-dihydrouridine(47) synthase [NAD(P)(+)] n=1 Tax=Neodothiora populina TaxID=2781224 RepID=A0ABR3P1E1_9PEZI